MVFVEPDSWPPLWFFADEERQTLPPVNELASLRRFKSEFTDQNMTIDSNFNEKKMALMTSFRRHIAD